MTGIPNTGPQQAHTQLSRPARPHSNGPGTYGLSIRVQGIDGHPYVVLNNQDRAPQTYFDPNTNTFIDTDGSFIDNYDEYDFRAGKEAGANSPFMEYRSQKTKHHYSAPQNGLSESQDRKPSTLLNFQKHPEILQPYDPERNSLNLDGFSSLPSRPLPRAETSSRQQSSSKSTISSSSSSSSSFQATSSTLDPKRVPGQQEKKQILSQTLNDPSPSNPKSLSQTLPSSHLAQPPTRTQWQVAEPQSKPRPTDTSSLPSKTGFKTQHQTVPSAQTPTISSPTSEHSKTSGRSTSSIGSTNSSLERPHREPDVLPLRRVDSSGPVLPSSTRSRHSSSPSASKSPQDEQMEALYSDSINRHENRRYIPFTPGSGRDIDTGSIPAVDELIEKFDGKDGSHQRRGRAGRRNRINPEDRKRSRSVDSALGLLDGSAYSQEFNRNRGTSMEHVLRPSQLRIQKVGANQDSWLTALDGKADSRTWSRATSAPGSPENTVPKGLGFIQGYKKQLTRSSLPNFSNKGKDVPDGAAPPARASTSSLSTSLSKPSSSTDKKSSPETDVQVKKKRATLYLHSSSLPLLLVHSYTSYFISFYLYLISSHFQATPDLLKGQQELSQQTNEETAKQILFSYLKDG